MSAGEVQGRSQPPRRLLFVITDLDWGGAEKCLSDLVLRLDRRRWRPAVCCLTRPGALADRLVAAGVPVYSIGAVRLWQAPLALLRLVRLMGRLQPAIVHTFLFHANVLGRLAARVANVPHVISSIRVAERRYRHHLILENLTCRLAERTVCVSEAVAEFTRKRSHVPASRLVTVPNGIDPASADRAVPLDRSRLGVPDDAVLAAYVGRMDPQKGVDVLLRAAARVIASAPRFHLLLAGTGPDENSLVALARRLGIEAHAHFLGWRADVWALLGAADLFVMPSRWEGMPKAVLEAMAAGLPVVATRAQGIAEMVRDGETGRIVAIDDSEGLANALAELVGNEPQRRAWGKRGRELVAREFSLGRMVARYEHLFAELVGEQKSAREEIFLPTQP